MTDYMSAAKTAALDASRVILEARRPRNIQHKGRIDLVTEVDLASEAAIRKALEQHTPDIPVFAEEGGGAQDVRTRWIVDPLDGTTNFVHGFEMYGVSIALEVDAELVLGVIADPVRKRLYSAMKGQGAYCNEEQLKVSATNTLTTALVGTGFPYDRHARADEYLAYVSAVMKVVQGIRRAGAACMDLAMLASGQLDAFWEFHLAPWDVAAGIVLVQEAGGMVTGHDLRPLDLNAPSPLASNGRLQEELSQLLMSDTTT